MLGCGFVTIVLLIDAIIRDYGHMKVFVGICMLGSGIMLYRYR